MTDQILIDSGPVTVDTHSLRRAASVIGTVPWMINSAMLSLRLAAASLQGISTASAINALSQIHTAVDYEHTHQLIAGVEDCEAHLRTAADIYDATDGRVSSIGWWLSHKQVGAIGIESTVALAADDLYPVIGVLDIIWRAAHKFDLLSLDVEGGPWGPRLKPHQLVMPWLVATAEHRHLTRNGDTALEKSASTLSRVYPRIEKAQGTYLPYIETADSESSTERRSVSHQRDMYRYSLESVSAAALATSVRVSVTASSPVTSTPSTPAALLHKVRDLRDNPTALEAKTSDDDPPASGEFEILRHHTPGRERPTWSVVVKGTQVWGPGSSNPQDMQTNLATVGRTPSDQEAAIISALPLAGVQPGDVVEFVGHSQGGIVAASLAASPVITDHYSVASVITAGSPVSGIEIPQNTPVLSFENTADIVPALDGQAARPSPDHIVVYSTGGNSAHDLGGYLSAATHADNRLHADYDAWVGKRSEALALTAETVTSSQRFTVTRVRSP
ncbi:MAG: hypothetical protein Q4P05_02590 [Actinomycetaceae bacterium]|nr:hypothetical protein [Actinomycetaceae bacterium]